MSLKVYSAIRAYYIGLTDKTEEGHITLSFMDLKPTKKLDLSCITYSDSISTSVEDVQYWEEADITVLCIKNTSKLGTVKDNLQNAGFTYDDHEFIPHITVAKGNEVEKYKKLLNTDVVLTSVYIRIKDF